MIHSRIRALCCTLVITFVCAAGYARTPVALPPLNPSQGRVVIYRPWHYAASSAGSLIALNGKFVGLCRAGKYFYVDTQPGTYYMHVYLRFLGAMKSATQQTFTISAGQTTYVRLNIGDTFSVNLISADQAGLDTARMRFDPSATAKMNTQSARHVDEARLDFEKYKQTSGSSLASTRQAAFAPFASPATGAQPSNAPPATAGSMASGTQASLVVIAHCAKDPDITGMLNPNFYSDCKPKEMNQVRSWIAGALVARGIQVTDANSAADYQFAVTITRDLDKRPLGLFSDFAPGTAIFQSTYQVLDPAGHMISQGAVSHQGPDKHPDYIEKQFAQKIAASLAAATSGSSGAPSVTLPAANAAATDPANIVAADNLYELVAQAYRSLPVKPLASDNARAENRKASALMAAGNFKAAGSVYLSILGTDQWWPEAYRGLALALGESGDPADAIVWMRRYLTFEPNATDAVQMQARIDAWTRQAPPTPEPVVTARPGTHLGVMVADTPGVVAAALGKPDMDGALITLVLPDSPAEKATLQKGDIVVDFNGAPVHSAKDLVTDVGRVAAGVPTPVVIQRGSGRTTLMVTLQ